ncbi:hypothetical protein PILCRDRAFT_331694 [Piloderma croceum F 1598]|uniref:Uncharacterized protein n=1 Tax=Piloderma croceum (strain F 1598) TaxID=765440 RepID=A0A0C3G2D4_PILCF|nr:hypothetical protein PILCRDRAFT_331694 [Piloderma croceum F 1598]
MADSFSRCFTCKITFNSQTTSINQQKITDLVQSTRADKEPIALFNAVRVVCIVTIVGPMVPASQFPGPRLPEGEVGFVRKNVKTRGNVIIAMALLFCCRSCTPSRESVIVGENCLLI